MRLWARLKAWWTPPQPTVAVWTASAHRQPSLAVAIEAAMQQAVLDHLAGGGDLHDTQTVKAAMLAARARVLGRDDGPTRS